MDIALKTLVLIIFIGNYTLFTERLVNWLFLLK